MKNIIIAFMLLFLAISLNACSTVMANQQPDKKDLSVLAIGTSRDLVIAELGAPALSGKEEEEEYDIFSFVQGYSKINKTLRVFTYGALDLVTWGATEVITLPIETIATGQKTAFKVFYKERKVARVEELKIPTTQ